MIAINPAGINITTTYTGSAGTTNNNNMLFCRVSDTQYATIYNTA
jgi:hypothetical protein